MPCEHCQRIGASGDWHLPNVRVHTSTRSGDSSASAASGVEALKINAARLYDEQLHLLLSKNSDYSPLNISEAGFPDVMSGLTTRIGDKYYRIRNLLEKGTEAKIVAITSYRGDNPVYHSLLVRPQ